MLLNKLIDSDDEKLTSGKRESGYGQEKKMDISFLCKSNAFFVNQTLSL